MSFTLLRGGGMSCHSLRGIASERTQVCAGEALGYMLRAWSSGRRSLDGLGCRLMMMRVLVPRDFFCALSCNDLR